MTIALRATPSITHLTGSETASSLSLPKPSGVQSGDVLLIFAGWTWGPGTIQTPSGFTGSTAWSGTTGQALNGAAIFYRIADGTEGSSFTVSWGSSLVRPAATIVALSGAAMDETDLYDPNGQWEATTTLSIDSITVNNNNCWLFWFCTAHDPSGGAWDISPPAGYTEAADYHADSAMPAMSVSYKTGVSSGATGAQVGSAASSEGYAGVLVAITSPGTTYTETGSGAAVGAGVGNKEYPAYVNDGGAVAAGAGVGPQDIQGAAELIKDGGGAADGAGTGLKALASGGVTEYVTTGSGAPIAAGTGLSELFGASYVIRDGGGVSSGAGTGLKAQRTAGSYVNTAEGGGTS